MSQKLLPVDYDNNENFLNAFIWTDELDLKIVDLISFEANFIVEVTQLVLKHFALALAKSERAENISSVHPMFAQQISRQIHFKQPALIHRLNRSLFSPFTQFAFCDT